MASRRLLYSRFAIVHIDKRSLYWRAIVLLIGFVILFFAIAGACLQLADVPAPFDWSVK